MVVELFEGLQWGCSASPAFLPTAHSYTQHMTKFTLMFFIKQTFMSLLVIVSVEAQSSHGTKTLMHHPICGAAILPWYLLPGGQWAHILFVKPILIVYATAHRLLRVMCNHILLPGSSYLVSHKSLPRQHSPQRRLLHGPKLLAWAWQMRHWSHGHPSDKPQRPKSTQTIKYFRMGIISRGWATIPWHFFTNEEFVTSYKMNVFISS